MNLFTLTFWVLIIISLTGAATIHFGWILLFLFLSLIS